jgi:hypothetical protein
MERNVELTPFRRFASRMVYRLGFVKMLILVGLLGAAVPAQGQTFKVGSFAKSTGGAPVAQQVTHNLGVTPNALILWTNGNTNESFAGSFNFSIGMTDGTTSYSTAAASQDNVTTSSASRRMAAKALTIVQWGAVTLAEADLQSWDTSNFTLNWTTNNGTAYVIHYLIIGGDVSAKVLNWQMATATGNQSVTGIGFQPDVVIHAHSGSGNLAMGTSGTNAGIGLGVMDKNGNQWASEIFSVDAAATSDAQRGQQTNAALFALNNALTVTKKASYVSMDADGFTINYSTANANAAQVISLALNGVKVKAGNFLKSTGGAPASQSVTGVGFTPGALFLASFQDVTQANPVANTRGGIGAGDGTTEGSSAVTDTDALGTTSVHAIDKTSKVFMKVNNDTPAINAEADISSMGSDGFTLNWTTNDAVATQMLYLALGSFQSFGYMKPITIDRTKVGVTGTAPTTLSDFPLLINCADANLATTANGGHVTNANGYDIVFRSRDDAICGGAGTAPCQLDHEIEKYTATSGLLTAWVRLPSVNTNTAASDTIIWVYYGNPDVTSSMENKSGVWDHDTYYKLVTHMRDNPDTSHVADSTQNANNGTKTGAGNPAVTTSGQISDAQTFNGTTSYINAGSAASIDNIFTSGGTAEAWIYPTGWGEGSYGRIYDKANTDTNGWAFYVNNIDVTGSLTFVHVGSTNYSKWITAASTITLNSWNHVAVTFNKSNINNTPLVYINGQSKSLTKPQSATGSYATDASYSVYIGNNPGQTRTFAGRIDEAHLSTTTRSADWIITEYNNQSAPCSFYSSGSEQAAPPTLISLVSFTATNYSGVVQLKWKTGYEVSNLGFRVYREDRGKLIQLTKPLIAGSALFSHRNAPLTSGRSYTWKDVVGDAQAPVRYWLEDVDVKGKSTWHGPVTPENGGPEMPQGVQAALLSSLGKEASRSQGADAIWREEGPGKGKTLFAEGDPAELMPLPETMEAATVTSGNLNVQWDLAGKAAIKILVKQDGWYRVRQPELLQAGLSAGVDPRYLRLFAEGNEQPMVVYGQTDRKFDAGDWIEFYGTGLDTASTDTRVYWLVADNKIGKRVTVVKGTGGRSTARSYSTTVELREKLIHWAGLLNGDAENFFGSVVSTEADEEVLTLNHVDVGASGSAVLELGLQGVTEGGHQVRVQVNGTDVGTVTYSDESVGAGKFTLPQALLRSGDNVVGLVALNGEDDVSLVSYVRMTYWHTFEADGDVLRMTVAGNQAVTVEGFSSGGIRVLDVTNPLSVQEVTGTVAAKGTGYAVTVGIPGAGTRRVIVLTDGQIRAADGVRGNVASSWNSQVAGADVVMVTHGDFIDALKALKEEDQAEGYTVAVVNVEDVYDEFSYGEKTPQGVRDFLLRAQGQWKKKPRYLVLVGDASFDPRDYLGFGDVDYVPTKLVDTEYLETASDDWFGDFNGDGVSEIAVGRISVRTAAEAAAQVGKIVGYKQAVRVKGPVEGWTKRMVLAADQDTAFDFGVASDQLLWQIPSTMTVREIFRGQMDDATARSSILQSLSDGVLLMNYLGHGSVEVWRGDLLTSEDAAGLSNGTRLPFLVSMTCLNGMFDDVYTECLAEALMKAPNGGTVGVWASSGLSEPERQAVMNMELYRQLFGTNQTVGEAILKAKGTVRNMDIRRTWILFGDPTLKLRF